MTEIRLRAMTLPLLRTCYQAFETDPDICLDLSRLHEYTCSPERVEVYFERVSSQPDRVDFMVMPGERPVGEVALKRVDRAAGTCELAIHLQNDGVKDRGFGTQAERLAVEYAFHTLGLRTVLADGALKNASSRNVLEKVGFRQIGEQDGFACYRLDRGRNAESAAKR